MKQLVVPLVLLCSIAFVYPSCKKQDASIVTPPVPTPPVEGKTYSAAEVAAFKQLTFEATGSHLIYKLPTEVSVFVIDTTKQVLYPELIKVLNELNSLLEGSTHFTLVNQSAGARVLVYFTNRDSYLKQEPTDDLPDTDFTGLTQLGSEYNGARHHSSVFVDTAKVKNDTIQVMYFIRHEMMHALGLIGHVDAAKTYSILTKYAITPYITDYTQFDKKMMLLLYNPNVTEGMDEASFNAAIVNL